MSYRKLLAAFTAAVCCVSAAGCSSGSESQPESVPESTPEVSGVVGELITPDEDSQEYELGSYRISPDGVKLYNEGEAYPIEVLLALEKYFGAYAAGDYDTYLTCLYPGYADKMEEFLQENYEYGLSDSFELQCDNLVEYAGGSEYKITRIRVVETEEESPENFFSQIADIFGEDYYDQVAEDSDNLYDMYFSIIAEADGEETLLIDEFEIVFAEKDGVYYTFG